MRCFHKDVFMPKVNFAKTAVSLFYTRHAQDAAQDDRYGNLTALLPAQYQAQAAHVVELTLSDTNRIEKVLFRLPNVTATLDLCLVVVPGRTAGTWTVKTVWANESNDSHRTLRNREKFATKL